MTTPPARAARILPLLALGALALGLSACAPDPNGPAVSGPAIEDPGPAVGDPGAENPGTDDAPLSEACEAAFPDSPFGRDLAAAPTVPGDWVSPEGVELCTVFQASDTTAMLQYASSLEADAVLDAWESLLGQYTLVRDEGILNGSTAGLTFTIQPYADLDFVVVGFEEGGE